MLRPASGAWLLEGIRVAEKAPEGQDTHSKMGDTVSSDPGLAWGGRWE